MNQLETPVIILVNIFPFFNCVLEALKAETIVDNYILTYNQQLNSQKQEAVRIIACDGPHVHGTGKMLLLKT